MAYQIHLVLVEEDTGTSLAQRIARVSSSDLAAGKRLLDDKAEQVWTDLFGALPVEGVA